MGAIPPPPLPKLWGIWGSGKWRNESGSARRSQAGYTIVAMSECVHILHAVVQD